MLIRRGDLFWVNLSPTKGSEQSGKRPVVILQNNIGNEFAATTIIAPLTTANYKKEYPTNVFFPKGVAGLKFDTTALLSQIRVIDKLRLEDKIGSLPESFIIKINKAIKVSLGL